MATEAHVAIAAILHNTVLERKPQNSKLIGLTADPNKAHRTGTVFAFRDKIRMSMACGVVLRSIESLDDNEDKFTHWTPNVFCYGKRTGGTVSGFTEGNLFAINTFVIDIDFPSSRARDSYARQRDITWDTIIDGNIFPTLILLTDKGYQVYYVLRKAAFVRRRDDRLRVVESAKIIAKNLKECLAQKLPQVDLGANDFGIARIPRNDNIVFFEPHLMHRFSDLKQWSIRYSKQKRATKGGSTPQLRLLAGGKQIDQAWFGQVLRCTKIHATGKGGGVGRHNAAFTLALACYQSGVEQEACDHMLDEWNTRLNHPQNLRDVAHAVRDAYSGRYQAASPVYIKYISYRWFDGQLTIPPTMWYKFAKSRDERKYSHAEEWADDTLTWLQAHLGPDGSKWTVRQLTVELGMSKAALDAAFKQLRAQNKITVATQRGCMGYTWIQTVANIYAQLVAKRNRSRETYGSGLAFADDWADELSDKQQPSMAQITQQIDLFFDSIDPPDTRRGAG